MQVFRPDIQAPVKSTQTKQSTEMKRFGSCLLAFIAWLSCSLAFGAGQPVLVVGHKNPDTDAIISAIAVAHLKTKLDDVAVIESAFASKSMEKSVWLPGVMSRKKQVVPVLEQAFE